MTHSHFTDPFEALDEARPEIRPLYLELTCCEATTPDVVSWPLTAGPDENGIRWGYPLYPGDEVPCPHCGEMGTVYAISSKPVLPVVPVEFHDNGAPNICVECGGRHFFDDEKDYIASILCEYEIKCSDCGALNAIYSYGHYQHITQV